MRNALFVQYKSAHKVFDKAVKKAQRQYQYSEIKDIDDLLSSDQGMQLWQEIGKVCVNNCKQNSYGSYNRNW